MITSFKHRGLRRFHERNDRSGLPQAYVPKIERALDRLDVATGPEGMDVPEFGLHPLRGNLDGFWSVRVSANLRITFRFEGGDAYDVDLTDYH